MNNAKKQRKRTEGGDSRDLFNKIGNIKGTFHPKMGTIKDRNCSRRDHKYCTKKILMTWITTMEWSLTHSQTLWSVKSSGP